MILILGTELDTETEFVCDWLSKLKGNFQLITAKQLIPNLSDFKISKNINNISFYQEDCFNKQNKCTINLNNINVVYNRKWIKTEFLKDKNYNNNKQITDSIILESQYINDFIFKLLENKIWIDKPFAINQNKLNQLYVADKVGLKIPSSIIVSQKQELLNFTKKTKKIITKLIISILSVQDKNKVFNSYTKEINKKEIKTIKSSFFSSFIQEKIEKEFEIRVFYLNNKCYSMAIFSQQNKQTEIDSRRYSKTNPNRTVPFILPNNISKKICMLMNELNLTTGSIDLIYSPNGNYYFLEVNPSGIYNNVSETCNYNIEKLIAEYLIQLDENEKK